MNQNQLWSVVRMALSFGGGILVTFGYLSTEQLTSVITAVTQIIGPLSVLASLAWGLYTHTKAQTVAKAADIVPISAQAQRSAGVIEPVLIPTNPKVQS